MSKRLDDFSERWTGLSISYPFVILLLAIIALKTMLLGLDFTPGLFQGDSETYLDSAIYARYPSDRSFVYGLLLRYIALRAHTLSAMILFQAAASGFSAWIVAQSLVRHFGVRFSIAAACAVACAVEPLQLISERLCTYRSGLDISIRRLYFLGARICALRKARLFSASPDDLGDVDQHSGQLFAGFRGKYDTAAPPLSGSAAPMDKAAFEAERGAFIE